MTTEDHKHAEMHIKPEPKHDGPKPARRGRTFAFAGAGLALLAIGGGVGATAIGLTRPSVQMAPLAPVAITAMADDSVVTVKGKVAEVFGNKFVLQDDSGRTLIETGRAGEGGKLVKADEPVTVQGRFDDGFVKAAFLVRADGKTEQIGGFGPKGGGKDGPGKHGPRHGGPDGDGPRERGGPDAPAREGGPL